MLLNCEHRNSGETLMFRRYFYFTSKYILYDVKRLYVLLMVETRQTAPAS